MPLQQTRKIFSRHEIELLRKMGITVDENLDGTQVTGAKFLALRKMVGRGRANLLRRKRLQAV